MSITSCERGFKGYSGARLLEYENLEGDGEVFIWEETIQCSKKNRASYVLVFHADQPQMSANNLIFQKFSIKIFK